MRSTTMLMFAAGLFLAFISAIVVCIGPGLLYGRLNWLPLSDLVLTHPAVTLSMGIMLIICSAVLKPGRVR